MRQWFKFAANRFFPRTTGRWLAARARRANQRLVRRIGSDAITKKLVDHFGSSVQCGPFAGMILTSDTHAEHLSPYLLGTYESELHPIWQRIRSESFAQIIDVGAKFGYYAVGLARDFPDASVLAFDTDPWAQTAVARMAAANATTNVSVLGFCSPGWLAAQLPANSLIVSDCEGYEAELFSVRTAALDTAWIVVETHDFLVPGTVDRLLRRFAASHMAEAIPTRPPVPPPGVDLSFLGEHERALAISEMRPEQKWLIFTPRSRA